MTFFPCVPEVRGETTGGRVRAKTTGLLSTRGVSKQQTKKVCSLRSKKKVQALLGHKETLLDFISEQELAEGGEGRCLVGYSAVLPATAVFPARRSCSPSTGCRSAARRDRGDRRAPERTAEREPSELIKAQNTAPHT